MAVVSPFRGVRYNPDKIENIEEVLTPPYDVINEEEGARFLKKNPYNMIQLDLRNTGQRAERDQDRYGEARDRFANWQDEQVLIRDEQPALYLYFIEYKHPSGKTLIRKGLVGLVGLAEFSEGIVKPHEQTFSGVIKDRLELMDTCGAQFSQVFSLYSDPEQEVMARLEAAREPEPVIEARDRDGNLHTLWRVSDPEVLREVAHLFKDKSLYIADGHHRYTTALACRRRARERDPELAPDSPYNFIMMYLCSCEDPGLSVLPTHRLLNLPGQVSADRAVALVEPLFVVDELPDAGGSRESLVRSLLARMDECSRTADHVCLGMYHPGEDRAFLLTVRQEALQSKVIQAHDSVLRNLDVVILSDLVLHGALGLDHEQCVRDGLIAYFSDVDAALDLAVKKSVSETDSTPLLFFLNPTRVSQVTDVADQGEIMPHKSTFFYPKILTGLLLNKLTGEDD